MSDTKSAISLYGQAENNLSLSASLEKAKLSGLIEGAVGLFYSPKRCCIGRMKSNGEIEALKKINRTWTTVDSLDVSDVFEAKLFTKGSELNWLNDPYDIGGRAVLVTTEAVGETVFKQSLEMGNLCGTISQSYLVWGQYDLDSENAPDDWVIVSTSQIGQLAVPISTEAKDGFALLNTQEYLVGDDYGNVYVKYERTLNLSWGTKEEK